MSQPAEPLVSVYVTNGTRTSAGPGPGVKTLPAPEAGALVTARLAVHGDREPGPEPEPVTRAFPYTPVRPPPVAVSNGASN